MALLTFVTAVAPYHTHLIDRVRATVLAQTVACDHIIITDTEQRGAGWARNYGLAQVLTPFVSFLDADDTIDPTFAEQCLRAYDGVRYVYTDWLTDSYIVAPDVAWHGDGSYHILTTLLPAERVKALGGFDEDLPALEDTDFYWKLTRSGLCGKRLPEALFTYGAEGRRSAAFRRDPRHDAVMQLIVDRYRGMEMGCTNCSDSPPVVAPLGEPQPGDVLADMTWNGQRSQTGRVSRRLYQKYGNATQLWVDPRDIDAAPMLFRRVVEMPPPVDAAEIERFRAMSHQALGVVDAPATQVALDASSKAVKPNVRRVRELTEQRLTGGAE